MNNPDLAHSVEQFRKYSELNPIDESKHLSYQASMAASFQTAIKTKDRIFFKRLAEPTYGNTGQQSHYYDSLRSESGTSRVAAAFDFLLNGSPPLAERISELLSKGEHSSPGLSEVLITKALAITNATSWLPIFPRAGDKGKRRMLELLKIEVPDENLPHGQWTCDANARLLESLQPYFGNDTWNMMRFLYSFAENRLPPLPPVRTSEMIDQLIKICSRTRNLLLYGPPGTGKTFTLTRFRSVFLQPQLQSKAAFHVLQNDLIANLTWLDAVWLTMHTGGQVDYEVTQIMNLPPMSDFLAFRNIKNERSTIWTTLSEHTSDESETVKFAPNNRRPPYLFDKSANSRWRLTEEGKAYASGVGKDLLDLVKEPTIKTATVDSFSRFVTLHQSFSYEEFIEGLKPIAPSDGDDLAQSIQYKVQDGIFKEIATRAKIAWEAAGKSDNAPKFLLILDEINRANIAKVFGELITLIEDDKRLGQPNELTVTLPYSQQKFGVPPNLYILGTLNTADRSIAQLDIALRRRFTFVYLPPDPNLLSEDIEGISLKALLTTLNERIAILLDADHQIGHSYLLNLTSTEELHFAFTYRILPLLQEYFYNDTPRLRAILGKDFFEECPAVSAKLQDFIASEGPTYKLKNLSPPQLISAIQTLLQPA